MERRRRERERERKAEAKEKGGKVFRQFEQNSPCPKSSLLQVHSEHFFFCFLPCIEAERSPSVMPNARRALISRGLNPYHIFYVAFFNECQYEMQELTSGTRILLVYDLVWKSEAYPIPRAPPPNLSPAKHLAEYFEKLFTCKKKETTTDKMRLYLFDTVYRSSSDAVYASLSESDRSIVDLIRNASTYFPMDLYLAKVTLTLFSRERNVREYKWVFLNSKKKKKNSYRDISSSSPLEISCEAQETPS